MTPIETVEFVSGDHKLVGDLRIPNGDGPWPAAVFTGPFTGVRDQVVGVYAEGFAQRGLVTLAFDHRNFGDSSGTPRQHEDSGGKLADLSDAVSVLASDPRVDSAKIATVGICLGGGYAARHVAMDGRVAACVVIAGCFNDPVAFQASMGPDGYRSTLRSLTESATTERSTGDVAFMPAVATDGEAAMTGDEPFAYYGTERGASPRWVNQVTRRSIHSLLTFDAASAADLLTTVPLIVIHGRADAYCSPAAAEEFARRAGGEFLALDADQHIDLYDRQPHVGDAVKAAVTFLERSW
ncbi:MAG: alpha/beta hydrolase [Nitriliruptoraceae bacterium]